ncbi:MAG: carboxynorspermidine decarboxylase [Oscillospiraceae bacterium]|nr:carboxynorspermidine decarboxylase [Oscillospiraceae bacterium]
MKFGASLKTPCYVIDESGLVLNLVKLRELENRTGCRVLLAQKAFSAFAMYPLIAEYISGTTASGLFEARLAYEEFPKEVKTAKEIHVYSPAYTHDDIRELGRICDVVVFNTLEQWEIHKDSLPSNVSAGLRVNPEKSTQEHAIYDPCSPFSRLGTTIANLQGKDSSRLKGIDGLHFHTLCEQDSDALESTLEAFLDKFGGFLSGMKWVNLGGGHHITREGYDFERLVRCVERVKKYVPLVYIEPGEAVALNSGWLAASVLDIVHNGMDIAILDASAACHMPDVLEMPYRPQIVDAFPAGEKPFTFRLAGNTCLAGDVIGDYSFENRLKVGDKIFFCDMAIYSMVKNNTFNGTPLPSIAVLRCNGDLEVIKEFGYEDFKNRLS